MESFLNLYHGVYDSIVNITFWGTVNYLSWTVSSVLCIWMIYDWGKTDGGHSEAQLTSSREGEIEAVSEKHRI